MDITTLIQSGGLLAAMGVLFGLLLGFASKVFHVEVDERVQIIRDLLPGANCGGCGQPSCDMFAVAVIDCVLSPADCVANIAINTEKIAHQLGQTVEFHKKEFARVECRGTDNACPDKAQYQGLQDCRAAMLVAAGQKGCRYACVGMGNCVSVCPFDAIHMGSEGLPVVDEEKCTGCGACVKECPRNVITLMPEEWQVRVLCRTLETGRAVRDVCANGCITCRMCERTCKFDAIHVQDNKARIDFAKCVSCMECAEKCPTGAIEAEFDKRKMYWIDQEDCDGNGACRAVCPFDAIFEDNKKSIIDPNLCHGCGECVEVCPNQAISTITEQTHASVH